jgi:hypothetical protein
VSLAVAVAGSLFACGGSAPPAVGRAEPVPPPERTAAESRDLRMLLVDLTAARACKELSGKFLGLGGTEESGREAPRQDQIVAKQGRLWIERCRAERVEGDRVRFELGGRGWRWVDKKDKKLGARFRVSQYVPFEAQVRAVGTVDVSYARSKRVLHLMLTPTEPVTATVSPTREVDARADGAWAGLLGAVGTLVGKSPDGEASKKFSGQGSQRLAERLSGGYNLVFDLCSGQKYETLGTLPDGALPPVPVPTHGRRFKSNERVRLHEGGIDVSGPFKRDDAPFAFELSVEEGDGVIARVVCATEARRAAQAFLSKKPLPELQALASELVEGGQTKTLRVEAPSCDLVLLTEPSREEVVFSSVVYPEASVSRALVPCR